MPAPKKVWIPDGSIAIYPSAFTAGSVHGGQDCMTCHGGAVANSRAAAHAGTFRAIPLAGDCSSCHGTIAALGDYALHTTLDGYEESLALRGVNLADPVMKARYDAQCTKCHTAGADTSGDMRGACGQCHVSVPTPAGGGFISGHRFQRTPSMVNNCTACHGSRVKDEFFGSNNDILARNRAAFPADSPWKDSSFTLLPDVHKEAGKDCSFCHSGAEVHGVRAPLGGGRYSHGLPPKCEDCHPAADTGFAAVAMHQVPEHLATMSCQVCHVQPYKNCFSCHTDVTSANVAFYRINEADPNWNSAGTAAPDALIGLRIGRNPRYTEGGTEKQYVPLRHVPVDRDTFRYTGTNVMDGLIPAVTARPTWFPATPHTIRRTTAITSACSNCHGADAAKFWLTDPVGDAHGWIAPAYLQDEIDANGALVK